jgi:hypothetical protein
MTAAAITSDEAKLDVGWVVGATWRVLRTRAVDLTLIALPFLWLPSVITGFAPDSKPLELLMNLPALVFTGGASLLTYRELTGGERIGASDATRQGAARFGTLWGVAFLSAVITIVGLVLLIVPGIIAAVGMCGASTAVMAENKTSVPALQRAWELSRGQRWRLTGLGGLLILAVLAVLLVGVIIGAILGATGLTAALDPVWQFGYGPIAESLIAALAAVGAAAAYVGLRTAKEGPAEEIAHTFD